MTCQFYGSLNDIIKLAANYERLFGATPLGAAALPLQPHPRQKYPRWDTCPQE